MAGAMPALTKNTGFATVTGRLLERERKMLKKGPMDFYQAPRSSRRPWPLPLTCVNGID